MHLQVLAKIKTMEADWKKAKQWKENTGQGILENANYSEDAQKTAIATVQGMSHFLLFEIMCAQHSYVGVLAKQNY